MPAELERRRLLLAAPPSETASWQSFLARSVLKGWETLEADSFERARFVLQHDPCDAVLVDESLCRLEGREGLTWLAAQRDASLILVSDGAPDVVAQALETGVDQWLPRALAETQPALLAAVLQQAARLGELRRRTVHSSSALEESRRQVDQLVGIMWKTMPEPNQVRWFPQRHMLERLQEEVTRSERYGSPFTVVLGEMQIPGRDGAVPLGSLPDWVVERIGHTKRRCDVAGQYGPRGFMLLLVHTAEEGGKQCCRRLQTVLEAQPESAHERRGPLKAYFGVASYSPEAQTTKKLLTCAEQRLEEAKAGSQT